MPLWILDIAGWLFVKRYWILYGVLGLFVLFGVLFVFRACSKPAPKLNNEEIRKAQDAIAANDRKTQIEVLANSDVREQAIDANVAAGRAATVNAITDAKEKYAAMSNDELAQELERRSHE